MKTFSYIFLTIMSIIILPMLSYAQCLTLSEPLFLQAPDSICADNKELVIKASKIKEKGAKYLWRTPLKDTLTTDSTLRILKPSVLNSGNYFVAVVLDSCQTELFGPINVQVLGVQKTKADTVKRVLTCNRSEISITSTYKMSNSVFGQWRSTEGVVFDNPKSPTTLVKGLPQGESTVVWLLSTTVCPFFVKDTFIIQHEIAPELQTDGTTLKIGEASKTIHLGHVSGSNLNLITEVKTQITKPPRHGVLNILSDGKRLTYNRNDDFNGRDAFELTVCNMRCPNLCSAPVPFTIDVLFDAHYPNVTLPKLLAPHDLGDAKVFRIEKIEDYPENELQILNRWGNTILTFKNYKNQTAWDGHKGSDLLPAGAYYYLFQAQDPKGKPLKPLASIFYVVY